MNHNLLLSLQFLCEEKKTRPVITTADIQMLQKLFSAHMSVYTLSRQNTYKIWIQVTTEIYLQNNMAMRTS
jgi:hypothetical protein